MAPDQKMVFNSVLPIFHIHSSAYLYFSRRGDQRRQSNDDNNRAYNFCSRFSSSESCSNKTTSEKCHLPYTPLSLSPAWLTQSSATRRYLFTSWNMIMELYVHVTKVVQVGTFWPRNFWKEDFPCLCDTTSHTETLPAPGRLGISRIKKVNQIIIYVDIS